MTQPTPYRRGYDFSDAGGAQPPGGPLDVELDALTRTTRDILRNMALLQRDDAALRNGIVGIDALDSRVLGLISGGTFSIAGTWSTATSYPAGAFLTDDGAIYLVMEAHASTTIVDDLAAGRIAKALQNEQGTRLRDDFVGNAVQTAYSLSQSPARPTDVEVYVNGALVLPDDYVQTGATVTFDVAPVNGAKISIFSITWATAPPIQTLVDAVGDRNAEISASTQFAADLLGDEGGAKVGLAQGGFLSDAILYVTPQMFGAAGTILANSTTAIQAAIDSNVAEVQFPPGVYVHGNLSFNNEYQRFVGPGAQFFRNANGTTTAVSARGVQFDRIRFSGAGFTGNNITVTAPEVVFTNCDSVETPGRALLADSDGGNLLVDGGIWNTTDASGSGYDIELKHTGGSSSLYSRLMNISTNQAAGGVLIDGQGTVRLIGCQVGKLTVTSGGGMFEGNRFNGAVSVQDSNNQFSNNAFASSVTFGNGAGANIGGIAFDSTNLVQSGNTLTINSDVIESTFHLGQLANVTLVLNGPNNDIWHGRIAYAGALGATGGAPAIGDGSLATFYSRAGREVTVDFELVGGAGTNYGTGQFWVTAPFKSSRNAMGAATVVEDGNRTYCAVAQCPPGDTKIYLQIADTSGAQNAGATYPFTWGANDLIRGQITLSYAV